MSDITDERSSPPAPPPVGLPAHDDRNRHAEWMPRRPLPVHQRPRRGRPPKNAEAPHGPEEVVRAVVDVAIDLFSKQGYTAVSLRQVAAAAGVNPGLVHRYIGSKEDVLRAVFDRFNYELEEGPYAVTAPPLSPGAEQIIYAQQRIIAHLTLEGYDVSVFRTQSPMADLILATIHDRVDVDDRTARIRAVQILALGLGWRLFEPFLLSATGLDESDRDEIAAAIRAANLAIGKGV
jgi:AcrR family transcriptional regulator